MDFDHIVSIVGGFLGVFLLVLAYTYLHKLDKIGCPCAIDKRRKFLKQYIVFAIVWIAITMFFPPSVAAKAIGVNFGALYVLFNLIFAIVSFVFFIFAIQVIRKLMVEKCKCSEDVRREILYIWALLEIIILVMLVILPLTIMVTSSAFGVAKLVVEEGIKDSSTVYNAVINPVASVRKIPSSLRTSLSKMKGKK